MLINIKKEQKNLIFNITKIDINFYSINKNKKIIYKLFFQERLYKHVKFYYKII